MGKTIIITEKPSVAQEYKKVLKISPVARTNGYIEGYSSVLGKDVQITWAVGHLISIASVPEQLAGKMLTAAEKKAYHWGMNHLPILPEKYLYLVNYATKDQFNVIKTLYKAPGVDAIYYAGDSGREGIYIQALIRNQIFGMSGPRGIDERVIWIDSYTEESIINGIRVAKPYSSYKNMIDSGYQRAIDDFLIGMNGTEGLTVKAKGTIVVGRVMSPVLKMVVKRQEEIDNFVPTNYYGLNAKPSGYSFVPKWKAVKGSEMFESDLLYNETGFLKEIDAKNFCRDNLKVITGPIPLKVSDISVTEKREVAPLLFNLADLQAQCSSKYHISPDDTLKIAQSLYEKKLTTYPRTDARVLSSAVAKEIAAKFGKEVPKKYVDDSKITDHYAIIPTFENHLDQCNELEKQVFNDIMLRFKAIFKPPYVYDSIAITLKSDSGEVFMTTEKQEKQLGFKELYQADKTLKTIRIPNKGDVLQSTIEINPMQTKAPAAYTTGTLILTMEKAGKFIEDEELREQIKTCGIGTSATRANVITKLADKGYIKVDSKQKVTATELGKHIVPIIESVDVTLTSPEKTADLEQKLADMANGVVTRESHEQYISNYINGIINKIKNTDVPALPRELLPSSTSSGGKGGGSGSSYSPKKAYDCPCCTKPLKYGQYGYYCESKDFKGAYGGYIMNEKDMDRLFSKGETTFKNMVAKDGHAYKGKFVLKDMINNKKEVNIEYEK